MGTLFYVCGYLFIGFILTSFLYIKDRITLEDHKIETNFLFYWIFWVLLLLFYLLENASNYYFSFLDSLSQKLKNHLDK